jgi:hypothetical protein
VLAVADDVREVLRQRDDGREHRDEDRDEAAWQPVACIQTSQTSESRRENMREARRQRARGWSSYHPYCLRVEDA